MFADLPINGFSCIMADPPWTFAVYSDKGKDRAAENHYAIMPLDSIAALPVRAVAADDCHLFLWSTFPNLQDSFRVAEAWGFRYSGSGFVWVKTLRPVSWDEPLWFPRSFAYGLGHTTRKNVEPCLLFRRGNPQRRSKDVFELLLSERREHSRKPDCVHDLIERYCDGPYLELFGRKRRSGWVVRGDEADKYTEGL